MVYNMQDENKTKKQLIRELETLRNQVKQPKSPDSESFIPFDTIFDAIPDVIGIQNTDHEIICYNKAGYKFLNVSPEEVKGKKCFEIIGRQSPCDICATKNVYKTKQPSQVQKYIESMGVWLDVRAYPVQDENGELTQIIEHLRDITTEKEMEKELEKSHIELEKRIEERTEQLKQEKDLMKKYLDVSGTIILALDCNQNITLVNNKGCEILGYNKDKIVGSNIFDIIPERYKNDIKSVSGKLLNEGIQTAQRFENPILTGTGEERIISWHNTVLKDQNGNITGTLSSGIDITERKLAEEKQDYLNQVLRAIRNVNQLITHENDRFQLIQKSCELLVETRGYHNAWIALMDENGGGGFNNIVQAGMGAEFAYIKDKLKDGGLIDCVQKALNQSDTIVVKNPVSACVNCPLPDVHKGNNLTRKLEYNNRTYGILSVTVPSEYGKDNDELDLFDELTNDLSYALYNLEIEDEKIKAYNKVQQSLKQYQDIFNGMNDAAFVHDLEGNFLDVNDVAVQRLGYSREELLAMGPKGIDDETSKIKIKNRINSILDDGYFAFEASHVTKTGKKIPVAINSSLVEYEGKPAILSIARDITERKKIEKALKENEKLYRRITNNMLDLVSQTDEKGVFEYVSPSHEYILGYKPHYLVGKNVFDFVHPEDRNKLKHLFYKCINNQKSATVEHRYQHADGYYLWLETVGNVVYDEDENDVKAIFGTRNVTERKKTEIALKESEKRYRTIFETTGSATAIADENSTFLLVNREFEKLSGYSKEEIEKRKNWTDFIVEEDLPYLRENYYKLLANSTSVPRKYEFRFIDRNNNQKYISMAVNSIPERKIAIATLLDITERKQSEETLRIYSEKLSKTNEELRELDKMKDEFISNLSHELRTPITSIKGFSELIYNEKLGTLNEKQKEGMDSIVKSCDRLRWLIESLLYVNKLQTEKIQYKFEPVDVETLIDGVVSNLSLQIKEKEISIEKYVDENLPYVNGDKDYLRQVLVHLMDNARKFTSSGGKIQIHAFNDADKSMDNFVHIIVKDNGIGIKKESIPDIFKLFYQIDGSMTRKYEGTGLGMYLCNKIIETHNGYIWVDSEENAGTDVHVKLPAIYNY
ncbi:PAS/PAC sensor signal transduction histidine kinase [Methanohalobium evestigatum Z-7303]|uniref:histidine kinase n=1 Tax=Methanohalobium evestigatum (strain ATCC BAA-1072 / DSM 3721 / NBRC 107634 / OCM 161 / Z-7303) TaxID=644295 RepID=D7E973_METEZ|nr:PAS domain-containing sensor histidine kinase [Methanohalobium evestigatum]ADI74021.1 PAS/PAC sensor signal transduction histidine kinase [Methanohalobium evestigatum Z-7303]